MHVIFDASDSVHDRAQFERLAALVFVKLRLQFRGDQRLAIFARPGPVIMQTPIGRVSLLRILSAG